MSQITAGGGLPPDFNENVTVRFLAPVGTRISKGDLIGKFVSWDYTHRIYADEGGTVTKVHAKRGDEIKWCDATILLEVE